MNFLQGLGGVGAGLITANQLLRQQKLDEENAKLRKSQIGMADLQLAKANKEAENAVAYGEIADQNTPGTQTIARANAPVDEWGNPEIETIAKPGDTLGAFDKMAAEALKRGDRESYAKFTDYGKHLKAAQEEGVIDLAKHVYAGTVDPGDAEKLFNATGKMRVAPGTVKWDADAGILSGVDAVTGQPISMDKQMAERYMRMSGAIKNPKYKSAGDGQVFNEDTGEVKGSPRSAHKPIVVNGAIFEQQDDGKGGVTYKKVAEAPKQASVVVHQGTGGAGLGNARGGGLKVQKTVETSDGIVAVMSDGSHKILTGENGKPLRGTSGLKVAAGLVGKTLNQYGENGDVAGKVIDMAGKLDGSGGTTGSGIDDAARYLNAATSQEDFNKRARELKAKGYTNEQIKAAAK